MADPFFGIQLGSHTVYDEGVDLVLGGGRFASFTSGIG